MVETEIVASKGSHCGSHSQKSCSLQPRLKLRSGSFFLFNSRVANIQIAPYIGLAPSKPPTPEQTHLFGAEGFYFRGCAYATTTQETRN